jgi:hypothetical protein
MGIKWNDYFQASRIITMLQGHNKQRYYKQGYGDKLEKLNQSIQRIHDSEGRRIKYASDKIKKWDKEIRQIEDIPKYVKYFLSEGYSNMFIELTILKKISRKQAEPVLGPCLCCHSKVCECEPYAYTGNNSSRCSLSDWYRKLTDREISEWLEGVEGSEERLADDINTIRLYGMVRGSKGAEEAINWILNVKPKRQLIKQKELQSPKVTRPDEELI